MATTLTAVNCPVPIVITSQTLLSDAYNTAGSGVSVAKAIVAGATAFAAKWNRNACQLDLTGRYGGGGYGICVGCTISAPGSGLALNIAAGQAIVDGIVEITAQTTTCTDAISRVWVWLQRDGTIVTVNNSLTPPSTYCTLLGSCVTSGGNITSVDFSGVVYRRGGLLYRETADTGIPTDSPSASVAFLTKTPYGEWLWDGNTYKRVGDLTTSRKDNFASTDAVCVPLLYQAWYCDKLTIAGTLLVNGKVKISG